MHRTPQAISISLALLIAVLYVCPLLADVKPSTVFGNGMVLQCGSPVPVWGRATPGEKVVVEFDGQNKSTMAGADGRWSVELDSLAASSEGRTLTISGENTCSFTDVLVGEVWICCGQSNMVMGYNSIPELKALLPKAQERPIRHFAVTTLVAFEPQENVRGEWKTGPPTSAVALAFSYFLQERLQIPVGVIQTCWGSSRIEGWMPRDMTSKLPHFATAMEAFEKNDRPRVEELLEFAKTHPKGAPQCWERKDNIYLRTRPNILYNAMLHPIAPFAVRGMAWYQGESNSGEPALYAQSLPAWVDRLRQHWGSNDFHLLAVMLPRFGRILHGENKSIDYPDNGSWAWFREAQMKVLEVPHTSVANTIDLGDVKNIHPKDKEPIGRRLAQLALRDIHQLEIAAGGPRFRSIEISGSTITVLFDDAVGLKTTDGKPPSEFWLAGKDRKWLRASSARIQGNEIKLEAEGLSEPVAVRYAFAGFPEVNLVNRAGLPAYPFRSDEWSPK